MLSFNTTTKLSRARRIDSYFNLLGDSNWIVIGKHTGWENDNQPPFPSSTLISIPEAFAAVYCHKKVKIYENVEGDISYKGVNYSEYTEDVLFTLPRGIMLEAHILPNSLDSFGNLDYRMYGLVTDVEIDSGVGAQYTLGEVLDSTWITNGYLEWVSSFTPISISGGDTHIVQAILLMG